MKKFLLTLGVAFATLTGFAGEKILYQQNFETVNIPADAGWSYPQTMTIEQSGDVHYLLLSQGQQNQRTAQVKWGSDIYYKDSDSKESVLENGTYIMSFDFNIVAGSNNEYNGAITVFTNHTPVANQPFRAPWSPAGYWQNFIFDMSQKTNGTTFVVNGGTIDNNDGTYSIDYTGAKQFPINTWYTVKLEVNTVSREVKYTLTEYGATIPLEQGTMVVPETNIKDGSAISMLAEGFHIDMARYQSKLAINNIKIFVESDEDVANKPSIALTGLGTLNNVENLNARTYTISFGDGETLHVTGTDGKTTEVSYSSCNGSYVYETETSGTLTAWTTFGSATSEENEETVECNPVVLPEAVATITGITEGLGKTYTLSADNSNVLLTPEISFSYEFTDKNGKKTEGTGNTVTVNEQGTLKVTTSAKGYQSSTTNIDNSIYYAVKKIWDFARMDDEEATAAGFPVDNYSTLHSYNTSGFDNWTARQRLWYKNTEGATIKPFGYDNNDDSKVLYYAEIDATANSTGDLFTDGIKVFAGKRVTFMKHIGLLTNDSKATIGVQNLEENDLVVVNAISDYGTDSNHPVCANDDEYYALLAGVDHFYDAAHGTKGEDGKYTISYSIAAVNTIATKVSVYTKVDLSEDLSYTLNYVDAEGNILQTENGAGKFGDAIILSDEAIIPFITKDGVKYKYESNDVADKTVSVVGTTVTLKYYPVADYTINYVVKEGDNVVNLKTVTKNDVKVGSEIKLSDADMASIEDNNGLTYEYVSNDLGEAGKTVSIDGKTVVTLTYQHKTDGYVLKYVVGEGKDAITIRTLNLSGHEGSAIEITAEQKAPIVYENLKYVYAGDGKESDGLTLKADEVITIVLKYKNLTADYTLNYVIDGGESFKKETKTGNVGEVITLKDTDKGNYIDEATGLVYKYAGDNATAETVVTEDGKTVVTITYKNLTNTYTLEYVANGKTLKTYSNNVGNVGAPIEIAEGEKEPIIGEDGLTYVYESDNSEGKKVTVEGTTVTLTYKNLKANYTIVYKDGDTEIKKVTKEGNVGAAINLSNADIAPFKSGNATYRRISDDAEGKKVTEEGTVVTISCKKTQGYVLHFVDVEAEDDHVIKDPVEIPATVGSKIVVPDEHKQEFVCKEHGVLFQYDSDDSEDKTVSEESDIVTVKCKAVKADYTLNYVVDGKSIKTETRTGRVGDTIEVAPEDLGDITDEDGNSFIFTGEAPEKTKVALDGSTMVTIKYKQDKLAAIDAIADSESVKVYDLNGHYVADEVEGLKAGIYIIRKGNTAKKVIIR